MTRFAFYGRVSTEDQQDPEASRGWQLAKARELIQPSGGVVVVEFFDIGQSRSLPWSRRPEAGRLLWTLDQGGQDFDAIVVAELARAFGDLGDQFGVMRMLAHYGVELWHPEAGGPHDGTNIGHRITAALRAELAQEERDTIKRRVRGAMGQQAGEGRYLGGRPPYGYGLVDDGPHPNPSKAAAGQRQHRLKLDPVTGPIVVRIFDEYIAGAGIFAIAEGLTGSGVPCPSAADPERNRHRSGIAWSKSAVRAILLNPRYTGRQVWNRQQKVERLVDVHNPSLGYVTKQVWNDPADWVWSTDQAHDQIIDPATFTRAQEHRGAGAHRPATRKPKQSARPYVLKGLLFCGLCGRRMTGQWNHDRAHYRCRLAEEYGLANKVDHPRTVYLREDHVVPELDRWIAGLFDPDSIEATCAQLADVQGPAVEDVAAVEAAHRRLADCDGRLLKHRAALEAGADPVVVSGWIAEVQGERLAAERALAAGQPSGGALSPTDLREIVESLGDVATVLEGADPASRAAVYADLGVTLTYRPDEDLVEVQAVPALACANESVGGGI